MGWAYSPWSIAVPEETVCRTAGGRRAETAWQQDGGAAGAISDPRRSRGASDLPGYLARGSYITSRRKGNHEKETSSHGFPGQPLSTSLCSHPKSIRAAADDRRQAQKSAAHLSLGAWRDGSHSCPGISGRERRPRFPSQGARVKV